MENVSTEAEEEDGTFVKTEDLITIMNTDSSDPASCGFLAGQGFGSTHCHLEPHPTNTDTANDLWKSTFKLEHSMSVHALYGRDRDQMQMSCCRRIVLYGHAVLLRHVPTDKILCCQTSTSLSTNKLAYDVGFVEKSEVAVLDNSCWFRVKPATKQRSEGEKVRTGDDVFLINVATERYLSAHHNQEKNKLMVQASFQQSLWAIHIMCCGSAKQDAIGYVNGGDVVRMIHRHSGVDCLTVATRSSDSVCSNPSDDDEANICFESEAVHSQVRSLWRVELTKIRFGGQFTEWGQPFRLRHVVTGEYLGTRDDDQTSDRLRPLPSDRFISLPPKLTSLSSDKSSDKLTLLPAKDAKLANTLFRFRQSLGNLQWREGKEQSMGAPQVKFGDSLVLLQHCHTGKWLGMHACDQITRGKVGQRVSRQASLHKEGHLNFALTITRGLESQIQAAVIMEVTDQTMRRFIEREFSTLQKLDVVLQMKSNLQELLKYFEPIQKKRLSYYEKKKQLSLLREKQNLFHNQGRLKFVASVIQKLSLLQLRASDTELIAVKHLLYQLLSAMIKGNKVNCSQFASKTWTDLFIKELANPLFTHDILDILLHESAEVVEYLQKEHVKAIVNLLNTHGREEKVLQLLSSLCVCHGAAVRDKQKLSYNLLSKVDDLLLHPVLHSRVYCYRSNIDLSSDVDNNVLARRWYYEVTVTKVTAGKHHLRAGWIDVERFTPSLGTFGEQLGSDYSSVGFDGNRVWTGGHSIEQYEVADDDDELQPNSCVNVYDVLGCCLDTAEGRACFTLNGVRVGPDIVMLQNSKRFTAAVSFSSGVEFKVAFGRAHVCLKYNPPPGGYSPLADVLLVTELSGIMLEPCVRVGEHVKLAFEGPQKLAAYMGFTPTPIDTTQVHLPDWVEAIEDRLAENIHDVWAVSKIDGGWKYNEVRNNDKKWHPMLRPFSSLTDDEKKYNCQISEETLKTLVALGYRLVRYSQEQPSLAVKQLDPDQYQQSNGYLPRPLDLSVVTVPEDLSVLVNMLAENNHNVWAMERIKQGWKYGSASDNDTMRSPALVPYSSLDAKTRSSNQNTANDVVRTVLLLGCSLEPTSVSRTQTVSDLSLQESVVVSDTRTFRGQYSHAVTKGKWYYEVKIKTPGMIRVGWTRPYLTAGNIVGTDQNSYSFDGHSACKWHVTGERFGKRWNKEDIVSCYLDLQDRTMKFAVNGKTLYSGEEEAAFKGFDIGAGFVPAVTLAVGQKVTLHFGKQYMGSDSLKHLKACTEYSPVCRDMCDNIPIWYSTPCGRFEPIIKDRHPSLSLIRDDKFVSDRAILYRVFHCCSDETHDSLTIVNIQHEDSQHHHQQKEAEEICLRLSMGLTFTPSQHHITSTSRSSSSSQRTSYSIIIPAGQDTSLVYIGWTTQHFKYYSELFQKSPSGSNNSIVGCQGIKLIDGWGTEVEYVTGYMMCLAELFKKSHLTRLDSNSDHVSSDYLIGCIVDQQTSTISYTVNKEHISNCDIKISHSAKLYPTVVTTPTTQTVATFKLLPENGCIPFSHMILKSLVGEQSVSILPYRLKVLAYSKSYWSRVDYYTDHGVAQQQGSYFGDIVMEAPNEEKLVSCIVPETGLIFNISQLLENERLQKFYLDTLHLYCAISSHGNEKEAADIKMKLNKELLLKCLQLEGIPHAVKRGYYELFSSLHLRSEVVSRLLTREERIIQLPPLLQTEFSIGPSVGSSNATMYDNSLTVLMANSLQAFEPRKTFTLNHSISGKLTMYQPPEEDDGTALVRLKEIVFNSLRRILKRGDLRCIMLTDEDRADIIVPLLRMLDNLLVIGLIQERKDIDQLLRILQGSSAEDNEVFTGILEQHLNEPIKLAVCDLLQHLCDCQLQHRVEAIVKFAHEYTNDLRLEQKKRFPKGDGVLLPKEFRTATEKQVKMMLQFVDGESGGDCPTSKLLRDRLRQFHHNLKVHCGLSQDVTDGDNHHMEEMSSKQMMSKIWKLLWNKNEGGIDVVDSENGVTELQQFIIRAMVKWSKEEIFDPKLISQIFSLLYRQYDEINEVAKALGNTYVLDQPTSSPGADGCDDVMRFRCDLATIRMRLEVGIAFDEELLNQSLKNLSRNNLFRDHPELVRSLGIHQLVLQLLDTYLGIDSATTTSNDKQDAKKLKYWAKNKSINSAVKMCCTFLCKFASVNTDNQRALFPSIRKLLKYSEEHPDLTVKTDYSLIKVATSTINNNEELVFELTEGHFEHIIGLLLAITTNQSESDSRDDIMAKFDPLGIVILDGVEIKWSPKGAEKLLDFLDASVCVAGKSVQENALIIIRLLIQRPECLGPALAGDDVLGLQKVYDVVTTNKLDDSMPVNKSFSDSMSINKSFSDTVSVSNTSFTSQVLFSENGLDIILPFYNSLVKLLAWCSPDVTRLQTEISNDHNDLRRSVQKNTHHILCSLISKESILGVLALSFETATALQPKHKEVVLQFLDKVYGFTDVEFLTDLLFKSFIPDIKLALSLENTNTRRGFYSTLCCYLCMCVMPYLTKYAKCIQSSLKSHSSYIIQKWLVYSYELSCQPKLPKNFLPEIAKFLSTVCVVLTPNVIEELMPRFILTVPDLKDNSIVALQYMTAHYSHFHRYYNLSGGWDVHGSASEDEKMLIMLMLYKLVNALCDVVAKNTIDPDFLKQPVNCMQALVDSLSPEYLIPSMDKLLNVYETKWANYQPSPCDITNTKMDANMKLLAKLYAEHQHDTWVHNKMSDEWLYGKTFDEDNKRDPKMVRLEDLPQEDKDRYLIPATRIVKVLSVMGWKIMQQKVHTVNVDHKDPLICYWPRSRSVDSISYVPSPIDLTNVYLDSKAYCIADKLASEAHDHENVMRAKSNPETDCVFTPYDLLSESDKEKKREYFVNFIKVMKACSYEVSKMRNTGSTLPEAKYKSLCKLGVELISYVLKQLSNIEGNMKLLVAVYCPLIHSFLCHYHDYFLPDNSNRSTTNNPPKQEEVLVVKLFCEMFTACKSHLIEIVPRQSLGDDCNMTKANVKVIVDCLTKICAVLNPKVMKNYKDSWYIKDLKCLDNFLEGAGRSLSSLLDNISCLSPVEFEYGFKILIPSLSMFFQHCGSQKFGNCIMLDDTLFNHCKTIFFNLGKLSKLISPLHAAAQELANIGFCLGSFIFACPVKFLHGQGIGEMSLVNLIGELEKAVKPDITCGNVRYVTEVIVPITFSYLCKWYEPPLPSRARHASDSGISLRDIRNSVQLTLSIIKNSLDNSKATWMYNASACVLPLVVECSLTSVFYDILKILGHKSSELYSSEVDLVSEEKNKDSKSKTAQTTLLLRSRRTKLVEKYHMLCRNLYAVLPLYHSYLEHYGTSSHEHENDSSGLDHDTFMSYNCILTIFTNWYSSQIFRRELQIETVNLSRKLPYLVTPSGFPPGRVLMDQLNHSCPADRPPMRTNEQNILVKCVHVVLPLFGYSFLDTFEKNILQNGIDEYKRGVAEDKIKEEIAIRLAGKPVGSVGLFNKLIYEKRIDMCLQMFDATIKLLKIELPVTKSSGKWKQFDIFRRRTKKAVIKCFLATSFYSLPMSRSVNLFLSYYRQLWLKKCINTNLALVKELTLQSESDMQKKCVVVVNPLQQLLNAFCVSSSVGQVFSPLLYISYCEVLSESCVGLVDDEEKYDEDDPTKNYEMFARDRSRVRQKQNQLCDCGAADMVIDVLSCNAEYSPAVEATLKLGVSLLKGGNEKVQKHMFLKLKDMDAIFYRSIQSLISCCSVLDWTTYERFNRAAPVNLDGDHTSNCLVLSDATFTHNLFRFLQLLCEGHNEDFQNNLRTQAGNTTTVNIVVYTVDYLLRLQESISDFYWHYSSYEAIDAQGREIFFKAFRIAKQIFRTLTEFIQGPCIANQMALANSRLWDATAGFLMVLAKLQKQLLQQSTQLELFRELVKVEKDLFILLLSMLEGNTSVSVACKMISTLVESSEHVEGMMKLYDMFMKLNDMVTSEAFKEYDLNKDGLISPSEFRKAMETLHIYSLEEIDYLMQCADTNKDGMLDYMEFTERFHTPAKNIGFSLCVLITNLSHRVPHDKGLESLKRSGKGILHYFSDNIGKIEIMGKSGRMEKVYFEIESSRRRQWKNKQIVESRKHFLQTSEVGSSREKLESFINFCEDTIFEMEHIAKITDSENTIRMIQAEDHLSKHNPTASNKKSSFLRRFHYISAFKYKALEVWTRLLPILILFSKGFISSCIVCGKYLWCKCKLLWKVIQSYRNQSPVSTLISEAPANRGRKSRVSVPRLPIPLKLQESVDGPKTGERSGPSSPRNPQAIREKWLNDPAMHLSFDYIRVKSPNTSNALTPTSSTVNLMDDPQATSNNREHIPKIVYHKSFQARIARNYYKLQHTTLFVAFCINLLLLTAEHDDAVSLNCSETVIVHGSYQWVSIFISLLAVGHFILSVMLFVAYGFLKVPLIICKCEKRAAHALQFRHLWTHVSPQGLTEHWDKLVIMSRHYPRKYFDKRVRHRVYEKLNDEDKVKCGKWIGGIVDDKPKETATSKWTQIMDLLGNITDPYYTIWTIGVVLSSPDVFYHVGFCILSLLGVYWNHFYFSTHLIYLVTSFKLLRTVLKSVFNNWKQLLMTFLMTCIVIYLYTVIAFNFFRKFYVHKVDDDFKIMKCQSMFQCFLYHIDQGLRSGGGIADVLLPAVGDDYENLRLLFDVTFFFVVIVILLAIIQGLIIDSFGELREKEKSAREDMKRKCYICGISKERFDQFPNGFENHTKNEHGMADYMYFLMYLISKPETEFSGQESYVWDHYIRRNWSFFPVGDCVQEQERRERERLKQNQVVVTS